MGLTGVFSSLSSISLSKSDTVISLDDDDNDTCVVDCVVGVACVAGVIFHIRRSSESEEGRRDGDEDVAEREEERLIGTSEDGTGIVLGGVNERASACVCACV